MVHHSMYGVTLVISKPKRFPYVNKVTTEVIKHAVICPHKHCIVRIL